MTKNKVISEIFLVLVPANIFLQKSTASNNRSTFVVYLQKQTN